MARTLADIAIDTLRCAFTWEPEAKLVGNVRADELALLAATVIDRTTMNCPCCGAEPWCDIDCPVCCAISELEKKYNAK
jgi:hypothetical protein